MVDIPCSKCGALTTCGFCYPCENRHLKDLVSEQRMIIEAKDNEIKSMENRDDEWLHGALARAYKREVANKKKAKCVKCQREVDSICFSWCMPCIYWLIQNSDQPRRDQRQPYLSPLIGHLYGLAGALLEDERSVNYGHALTRIADEIARMFCWNHEKQEIDL